MNRDSEDAIAARMRNALEQNRDLRERSHKKRSEASRQLAEMRVRHLELQMRVERSKQLVPSKRGN